MQVALCGLQLPPPVDVHDLAECGARLQVETRTRVAQVVDPGIWWKSRPTGRGPKHPRAEDIEVEWTAGGAREDETVGVCGRAASPLPKNRCHVRWDGDGTVVSGLGRALKAIAVVGLVHARGSKIVVEVAPCERAELSRSYACVRRERDHRAVAFGQFGEERLYLRGREDASL